MTRTQDKTGQRFGKWTVLGLSHINIQAYWRVRCDCGREAVVAGGPLKQGKSRSCRPCSSRIHGAAKKDTRTPEYRSWAAMIQRCNNPRNKNFAYYGGRGILVCERWQHSFAQFLADMGPRPSPKHSIDRINNDGGYEPGNCRWATQEQQKGNKRTSRVMDLNGEQLHLAEVARRLHLPRELIRDRIDKLGWDAEKAFTTPLRTMQRTRRRAACSC